MAKFTVVATEDETVQAKFKVGSHLVHYEVEGIIYEVFFTPKGITVWAATKEDEECEMATTFVGSYRNPSVNISTKVVEEVVE